MQEPFFTSFSSVLKWAFSLEIEMVFIWSVYDYKKRSVNIQENKNRILLELYSLKKFVESIWRYSFPYFVFKYMIYMKNHPLPCPNSLLYMTNMSNIGKEAAFKAAGWI